MSEPLWNDTDDPFIWYDVPPMVVEHIANLQNGFRGVDFVLTNAIDLLDVVCGRCSAGRRSTANDRSDIHGH